MTIKQFLTQALTLNKEISSKEEQIRQLRELQTKITVNTDGDRVQNSGKKDKYANISVAVMDLENDYIQQVTQLLRIKYDIKNIVEQVKNPTFRLILSERYINLKTWEDIAWDNNYSVEGAYKIHVKALAEAATYM